MVGGLEVGWVIDELVGVKRFGPLLRHGLLRVKWTVGCEELVGLGVKRVGPLLM